MFTTQYGGALMFATTSLHAVMGMGGCNYMSSVDYTAIENVTTPLKT